MVISNDVESFARETERLIRELRRADRGKRLSTPPDDSPADAAHRFAQLLADAEADVHGRAARVVPRLADQAAADQVAVIARELLDAMQAGTGVAVEVGPLRTAAAVVRAKLAEG